MTLLLAAAIIQPKLDFGPEIISIPELCRTFVAAGEKVVADRQMASRFVLTRLEGRSWDELRAMLAEGLHIQTEFEASSRTWYVRYEPERRRADDRRVSETVEAVGQAIQREAKAVLDLAGAQTHGFVHVETVRLREELEAEAKRIRGEDAAQFQSLYTESLHKLIALRQVQYGHAWAQLHSLAESGAVTVRKPGLRVWTEDAARFRERLRLDSETALPAQMRGSNAPINGTMVVAESFNWSTMDCQWRHHLVNEKGSPDIYRPHTSDMDWRPQAPLIEIDKRWPGQPPSEAAAILARIPGADQAFTPTSDRIGGLMTGLQKTDIEALLEVHPLCEFRLPETSGGLAAHWQSTLQKTEAGPLVGKRFLVDMSGREDLHVPTFLNKYQTATRMQSEGTTLHIHQRMILAEHDGVLLGQPALMPLYLHLEMPTDHYWKLVNEPTFSADGLRSDVRRTNLAMAGKWHSVGQPQRNMVVFKMGPYPILAAIERSGLISANQFWSGAISTGVSQITLSGDQALTAYEGLAAQGDMVAEAMLRGLVPPAPLKITARVTREQAGSEYCSIYLDVHPQMEGNLDVFNLSEHVQFLLPEPPQ